MPHCTQHELFRQAKAGGHEAFRQLRALLEPSARRFAQRLVGKSDIEEDIVQDAFISLYMNLERIDPVESLRPFLFRIVRNLCYDELRRKGRFQIVSLDEKPGGMEAPLPFLKDARPPPDEEVYWILLYTEVQKAVDRLPEMQRQTLILYCEEDLSYVQIAEVMATDIGTVKSRLHYARQNLGKLLGAETRKALGIAQKEKQGGNRS